MKEAPITVAEAIDNELRKYQMVNQAETCEDLCNCIKALSNDGKIMGRNHEFDTETMIYRTRKYFEDEAEPNVITRRYGLRQQAMYIKYYNK